MNSPEMMRNDAGVSKKEVVGAESKLEKKGKKVAFDIGEIQLITDFEAQNKIATGLKRELAALRKEEQALSNSIRKENLNPSMDDMARLEAVQNQVTEKFAETIAAEKQRAEIQRQLGERNPEEHGDAFQVEAAAVASSEASYKRELQRMQSDQEEALAIIRERLFGKSS